MSKGGKERRGDECIESSECFTSSSSVVSGNYLRLM